MNQEMLMSRIKAYFMRVNGGIVYQGYISSIEDSIKAFEEYVGNKIQVTDLENGMAIISILRGSSENPNRVLMFDEEVITVFFGNILVVRFDGDKFLDILRGDINYLEYVLQPIKSIDGYTIRINDGSLPSYRVGDD